MALDGELRSALDGDDAAIPTPWKISEHHRKAADLRVPLFDPQASLTPKEKIDQLGDYMLLAAFYHGELHAERLASHQELAPLLGEWDAIEVGLSSKSTRAQEDQEKAKRRPQLASTLRELRWRVDRLTEEIVRLDRDHDKVSRAYTTMTGS